MTPSKTSSLKSPWIGRIFLVLIALTAGIVYKVTHSPSNAGEAPKEPGKRAMPVKVATPVMGAVPLLSIQPGSVLAYESVRLLSEVPGMLKYQSVDIGDHVVKGQVLAIVDVPELLAQEKKGIASIARGEARIRQMDARVISAKADLAAANAEVTYSEAMVNSATAWKRYRLIQSNRMKELFDTGSIQEKVWDEYKTHYMASVETEAASQAAVLTSKAKVAAASAKIDQAKADVAESVADLEVAKADLEKTRALIGFATIRAPFDGVVTHRAIFPKGFVRAANEGANADPLLIVHRTDKFRVVVQAPDRDVQFIQSGKNPSPAYMTIDALPGWTIPAGIVSRKADSLDPQTRLMRVEVDLPNLVVKTDKAGKVVEQAAGKIVQGMYGLVTIVMDDGKKLLSVPSSCLIAKKEDGRAEIFVERGGVAKKVAVHYGTDNGVRVIIVKGVSLEDRVIIQPGNNLTDGAEVNAVLESKKE